MTAKIPRSERTEATRRRVLDAAARGVRLHGPDGVSVSAVMKEVGLTHGTFYAHFASKEDLVAAAVIHAADSFRADLQSRAATGGSTAAPPGRLADSYLTLAHARDPGSGCPIAALGSELSRLGEPIAGAFSEGVERSVRMIQDGLDVAEGPDPAHRDQAVASLATVVGGMILARAARDEAGAKAVLDACRAALGARSGAKKVRS